jgi:hypothetical protein
MEAAELGSERFPDSPKLIGCRGERGAEGTEVVAHRVKSDTYSRELASYRVKCLDAVIY